MTREKGQLSLAMSFIHRFQSVKATSQVISNGNRTEWSPIRSVIIRVMTELKNDCACVTGDPVGETVGAKISSLSDTFRMKDPRVS